MVKSIGNDHSLEIGLLQCSSDSSLRGNGLKKMLFELLGCCIVLSRHCVAAGSSRAERRKEVALRRDIC